MFRFAFKIRHFSSLLAIPLVISFNARGSENHLSDSICSDDGVENSVIEIAKEHTPNAITDFIRKHPHGDPAETLISNPEYTKAAKDISQREQEILRMEAWFDENERANRSFDGPKYLADHYVKSEGLNKAKDKLFEELLENAEYALSIIRTESRDDSLGKASCAAKIHIYVQGWGGGQADITYNIELTSDGDLYIKVSGLE